MNQQHEIAITHYCRLPQETAHPRFGHRGGTHSIVLTVNSGFE